MKYLLPLILILGCSEPTMMEPELSKMRFHSAFVALSSSLATHGLHTWLASGRTTPLVVAIICAACCVGAVLMTNKAARDYFTP